MPLATQPSNVRYVGPVLEGPGPDDGWRPPGVDDGRPLVVVGLGTTPMDEGPVLQRVLSALADAPVRVIATVGDHLDPDDFDGARATCTSAGTCAMPPCCRGRPPSSATPASAPSWRRWPTGCRSCACRSGGSSRSTRRRWSASAPGSRSTRRASARRPSAPRCVRAVDDLELRAGAARMAVRIDELVTSDAAALEIERLL